MGAGQSKVDLGNYAMKSYVQDQLDGYYKKEALNEALVGYIKKDDVQAQLKSFIESQGSTGTLDQKIASFLYIKQADLQKYLEKQDFDKEMLNYLKKVDLNTELQKYVLDASLEKRVAELGFTKQTQIEVPANRLDELAARITTLQGPRTTLVNAIAANQEGIPNSVADKIAKDETALTRISTRLGTTYKEQLAQSIAVNSTTLPDTVAEQIVSNDARAGILAGKIVTQQQNALVAQIKEKMIAENKEALKGDPGDIGNPQVVEKELKPKTMWCATGEYCEVPTAKKGLILSANQDIVGDGDAAKNERMVRVRDHLAFQSNTGIDFAHEVEAQAHDTPANQIKIHTRSMKDGVKDGTIRSRFDKTNDTEANAKNSALEIYGIGKSYGALRHPRQVKVFDNLEVDGTVKASKLEIGKWKFIPKGEDLYISKTDNTDDWKYVLSDDGFLHTARGVRIDKTADWRLSSNGGNNNLHVHKGPNYGDWHASFETGKTLAVNGDIRTYNNGNVHINEVNANRVNLGEFSMLYQNPWFFIGRKDNPTANWRAVVHQDIGNETVKSHGGFRSENGVISANKWKIVDSNDDLKMYKDTIDNNVNFSEEGNDKGGIKVNKDGNIWTNRTSYRGWIADSLKNINDNANSKLKPGDNINVKEVNATSLKLGKFSMYDGGTWLYTSRNDLGGNINDHWRAVVNKDIGDDTFKSSGGINAESGNVKLKNWKLHVDGSDHLRFYGKGGDQKAVIHDDGWMWAKGRVEGDNVYARGRVEGDNVHARNYLSVMDRWHIHAHGDKQNQALKFKRTNKGGVGGWGEGNLFAISGEWGRPMWDNRDNGVWGEYWNSKHKNGDFY